MQSTDQQEADFLKVPQPTLQVTGPSHVNLASCEAMGWQAQRTTTLALEAAGVEVLIGVITAHKLLRDT